MKSDFKIKKGVLLEYYGKEESVTIPNGVTSIGKWVFDYYDMLTNIIIPDSVTTIEQGAFAHCTSLTSIIIPDSVTNIGAWAFAGCTRLVAVTISNGVMSIGYGAFINCRSLTSITIPDSVTSIEYGAFQDFNSLKTYKNRYFKATDGNMQCRGFQYKLGKTYKTKRAKLCEYGFHACQRPLDIFNYYYGEIGKDVRLFEVELTGVTEERNDNDSKVCGTGIKFLRELSISELAELASNKEGIEK